MPTSRGFEALRARRDDLRDLAGSEDDPGEVSMKKLSLVALLLVFGALLGATVLRTPVAAATARIFVSNNSSHPVPVRSADKEVSVTQSVFQDLTTTCGGDVYTVPPGEELVAEYFSAWVPNPENDQITAAEGYFAVDGTLMLLPVKFESQAFDTFAASEAVHYVFPAGTRISFTVALEGASHCSVRFLLGGHLQPA
jgi:hypothetical protein